MNASSPPPGDVTIVCRVRLAASENLRTQVVSSHDNESATERRKDSNRSPRKTSLHSPSSHKPKRINLGGESESILHPARFVPWRRLVQALQVGPAPIDRLDF